MGCFLNGGVLGYTGPANPSMMSPDSVDAFGNSFSVDLQAVSWITGFLSLGSFFGGLVAGPIMEKIGRRRMMIVPTSVAFTLGYILIACAMNKYMLYAGRVVNGIGLGFELSAVTVYIVEIATTDMRGFLGCLVQGMGSLGIVFTFCAGAVLDWKWLAIANALWVIPFAIGMYFAPESPRWLVLKGKEYSAKKSLEWLRGRSNPKAIDEEIEAIKRDIAIKKTQRVSITQLKDVWKPFLVAITMMFIVQFSGFNVLIYYTVNIFQMARSSVNPKFASIIVGFTLLISCIIAIIIVSKLNRKIMLITSILVMCLSQTVLGYCMYHNEQLQANFDRKLARENITDLQAFLVNKTEAEVLEYTLENPEWLGWVPLAAVLSFLFFGNGGYGTLIWVVTAEILPPKVRSVANSVIICFTFLGGFVVSKTFVDLIEAVNQSGTFWIYAGVCLFGLFFTVICVPETRNVPIDEIQDAFNRPCSQMATDSLCGCCSKKS
eukprot:snap_masked-scaffold405_size181423-processed-gene-0.0 protein:Tk08180 transcript:snap_masked-scaffold405_size181423-processed-gene-0.0-mRNA-1 annotation:"facilitated trehalose transporter tret1-like isoform x2"